MKLLDPAGQTEFNRNIESVAKCIEIQRFRSGVERLSRQSPNSEENCCIDQSPDESLCVLMLERLTISNFRGIPHLELADLSRVNIFIGTNGAGKTSALEAAALIATPTSSRITSLGQWRDFPPLRKGSDYALRTLFYNLDIELDVSFAFKVSGKDSSLKISSIHGEIEEVDSSKSEEDTTTVPETGISGVPPDDFGGVTLTYRTPTERATVRISLTSNGIEARTRVPELLARHKSAPRALVRRQPQTLGSFFIHARRSTSAGETSNVLTQLFEAKAEKPFLAALRKIDKRVERLVPAVRHQQPIVLVDIGLPRLMPMNALGDGFCRVCLMRHTWR